MHRMLERKGASGGGRVHLAGALGGQHRLRHMLCRQAGSEGGVHSIQVSYQDSNPRRGHLLQPSCP